MAELRSMRGGRVLPFVVALALALAGCTRLQGTPPGPSCRPAFPYEQGWLGGDAAWSLPLSHRETLWLFGDTFVGQPGQTDRVGTTLVHNSIAISRCDVDVWEIDYVWRTDARGAPRAFLRPEGGRRGVHWWWLAGGFEHAGRLYLGLLEVRRSPPRGALALPFAVTGMQLARVENPGDPPAAWRIAVLPLWPEASAIPGSALVKDGDGGWLYLFAFLQRGDDRTPRVLARLPLAALEADEPELPGALQYLARDGRFRPGLDPGEARILMADDATEMSVVWRPGLGRWLATYSHPTAEGPGAVPSAAVFVRTAKSLEGPWSEPHELYRVPELDPRQPDFDPDTACYAAKEHPQFSGPGAITFTYVCNLFTPPDGEPEAVLSRLLGDMRLYRPRAVSLPLRIPQETGRE